MSVSSLSSASSTSAEDKVVQLHDRRTVLFPPGTSWPSSSAFFDACRDRLLDVYGFGMHQHNLTSKRAVAACQRRNTDSCLFRVVAIKESGTWRMQNDECRWEHTHPGGAQPEGAAVASARVNGAIQDDDSDHSSSSSFSSHDGADKKGEGEHEDAPFTNLGGVGASFLSPASSSPAIPQLRVTGMPQPGDRFATFKILYVTAVKAILPVYGISVSPHSTQPSTAYVRCNRNHQNYKNPASGACRFILCVKKDGATGEWVVQSTGSYLQHNHGAAPELLADPSWLPTIVNEDARAALGLPPGKRARGKAAQQQTKEHKRKKKKQEPGAKDHFATPAPFTPSSLKPTLSPPLYAAPYPPQPLRFSQPASSHASMPSSVCRPSSFSSPSTVPPFSTSALAGLSAFLASIHASLSALAATFLAAGVDGPDAVAALSLMEPESLSKLLQLVSKGCGSGRAISALQAKLLAKGMRADGGG